MSHPVQPVKEKNKKDISSVKCMQLSNRTGSESRPSLDRYRLGKAPQRHLQKRGHRPRMKLEYVDMTRPITIMVSAVLRNQQGLGSACQQQFPGVIDIYTKQMPGRFAIFGERQHTRRCSSDQEVHQTMINACTTRIMQSYMAVLIGHQQGIGSGFHKQLGDCQLSLSWMAITMQTEMQGPIPAVICK